MRTPGAGWTGSILRSTPWPTCRTSSASGCRSTTSTASASTGWAAWSTIRFSRRRRASIRSPGIAPIARAARETSPDCYLIGEYWPIHGTNPAKTAAKLVRETEIDAVWNGAFHHGMENCLFQTWQWEHAGHAGGARRASGSRASRRPTQVVNYVCSHDERRPEYEIQHWRDYIQLGRRAEERRKRRQATPSALGTGAAEGTAGAGGTADLARRAHAAGGPGVRRRLPAHHRLLAARLGASSNCPQGRRQFEFVQRLLQLRREHPALRSDFVEYYWDDFKRYKVVRYKRWDPVAEDVVVVAANFDNVPQKVGLGFPTDGWWRNPLTGTRHHDRGSLAGLHRSRLDRAGVHCLNRTLIELIELTLVCELRIR